MDKKTNVQAVYEQWLADPNIDENTKNELRAIADRPKEIEDRFFKEVEFGTGGMRGVMGAGTNRMNAYTIGRATQGLAQYLQVTSESAGGRESAVDGKSAGDGGSTGDGKSTGDGSSAVDGKSGDDGKSTGDGESTGAGVGAGVGAGGGSGSGHAVVIAYDSRNFSREFALEIALVLAGNGMKAYVFESLRPTPELSYAVRELQASAGIVVTASHNPPEYNGYKVYGSDGGQIVPDRAKKLIAHIEQVASFAAIRRMGQAEAEACGLLQWIGEQMDAAFIDAVTAVSPNPQIAKRMSEQLQIVYTPLHGAGNLPVRRALRKLGFARVAVVKDQELPDPLFTTVKSPNPEEKAAFTLALELAHQLDADIVIGTDPDCDRMGAVVKDASGQYFVLSGNQSGAIMEHYLLSSLQQQGKLPANGAVIKTIVTSELGTAIADSFGIATLNTLTGFKYIGEQITKFAATGEHRFLFGYEESYGYLAGTYARDKDAVIACMLICEAAAYYKSLGKTLAEVLQELYETHGYFNEKLESRTLKGIKGIAQIKRIMDDWRRNPPHSVNGIPVAALIDYDKSTDGLPQENVLKFELANNSWFCLRPSGTEPKLKVYFAVRALSNSAANEQIAALQREVMARVDIIIGSGEV